MRNIQWLCAVAWICSVPTAAAAETASTQVESFDVKSERLRGEASEHFKAANLPAALEARVELLAILEAHYAAEHHEVRRLRAIVTEMRRVCQYDAKTQQAYMTAVERWKDTSNLQNEERRVAIGNELIEEFSPLLGDNSLLLAQVRSGLGEFAFKSGEFEVAIEHWTSALRVCLQEIGPDDPQLFGIYCGIGDAAMQIPEYVTCEQNYNAAYKLVRTLHGSTSPECVQVRLRLARLRMKQGLWAEVEAIIEETARICGDRYFPAKALLGYSRIGQARVHLHFGEYLQALEQIQLARTCLSEEAVEERAALGTCAEIEEHIHQCLAHETSQRNSRPNGERQGESRPSGEQEVELHARVRGSLLAGDVQRALEAQEQLYSLRAAEGEGSNAFALFDKAVLSELKSVASGDETVRNAYVEGFLGLHNRVYPSMGSLKSDPASIELAARESLKCFEDAGAGESIYCANIYNALAAVAQERGDYQASMEAYMKAFEIESRSWGKNHLVVALRSAAIAGIAVEQGDWDRAERLLRESMPRIRREAGKSHAAYVQPLMILASLQMAKRQFSDAEAICAMGLRATESIDNSASVARVDFLVILGEIQYQFEELDAADASFQRALELCDIQSIVTHRTMARGLTCHAKVLEQLGRPEEAREKAGRAVDMLPDSVKEKVK